MKTKVFIISGFLGAGKTTFIQKLLQEQLADKKVALIENDFGEISVDANLLKDSGFQVKEMNAGCICCSLSGDFIKAMEELVKEVDPEVILIEPSGVGKLSDVQNACKDPRVGKFIELGNSITLVDIKNCKKYKENFGEFFEDQIYHADHLLLSRVERYPDKIIEAKKIIESIYPKGIIHEEPWEELNTNDMINKKNSLQGLLCHPSHEHHHHDDDCQHDHAAEEVFDTLTLWLKCCYESSTLKGQLAKLNDPLLGEILRAKGTLWTSEGWQEIQFVPDELTVRLCQEGSCVLTIIGKNLDKKKITELFRESSS